MSSGWGGSRSGSCERCRVSAALWALSFASIGIGEYGSPLKVGGTTTTSAFAAAPSTLGHRMGPLSAFHNHSTLTSSSRSTQGPDMVATLYCGEAPMYAIRGATRPLLAV